MKLTSHSIYCKYCHLQQDIEMPIPKYFVLERAKALKERQKVLEQILAKVKPQDQDMVGVTPPSNNDTTPSVGDSKLEIDSLLFHSLQTKEEQKMSIQEAVLIIQTMERARQGRLRAKFMKDIRLQEERERLAQQRGRPSFSPP